MIRTHTCYSVACDVCDVPLQDFEDSTMHLDSQAEARKWARHYKWHLGADGHAICDTRDADHQAAMDALLPPEPRIECDGQLSLDDLTTSS